MRTLLKYLLPLLFALNAGAQGVAVFHTSFETDTSRYCDYNSYNNNQNCFDCSLESFFTDAFTSIQSCDLFTPCDTTSFIGFGVPKNYFGYQYPHSGNNYVGLYVGSDGGAQSRELIGIRLSNNLKTNTYYKIEYYTSPGDSMRITVPPPQVYFCADSLYFPWSMLQWGSTLVFDTVDYSQIIRVDTIAHTNTSEWYKIEGVYLAKGNEKYLYFTNFYPDEETPWEYISDNSGWAYSYIDDITLYELDSTYVGLSESPAQQIALFPNPATNILSISTGNLQNVQIEFFDVSGRKLLQHQLTASQENIDVSGYANGVYICAVTANGKVVRRENIIISR